MSKKKRRSSVVTRAEPAAKVAARDGKRQTARNDSAVELQYCLDTRRMLDEFVVAIPGPMMDAWTNCSNPIFPR